MLFIFRSPLKRILDKTAWPKYFYLLLFASSMNVSAKLSRLLSSINKSSSYFYLGTPNKVLIGNTNGWYDKTIHW